jgi:hypothetical protein
MVSGPGYTIAYAAYDTSSGLSVSPDTRSNVTAQFNASSTLAAASGGGSTFTAGTIAGGLSADGVIGWGRWSTGKASNIGYCSSLVDVKDLHYAIGKTTATSELTALSGVTATYGLIGYTLPTDLNGNIGQAPSGTLTASFGASFMTVSINLSVPINSNTYTISGSTFSASLGPTFSINGACSSVAGFFAGTNASHAGVTYRIDAGGAPGPTNYISGAAAFKR